MDKYLIGRLNMVKEELDPKQYPETCVFLEYLLEMQPEITPYEIAGTLLSNDAPKPFPTFLIQLITDLYEQEIRDGNAEAMNDLGAQYYGGSRGFEQDFTKAVKLYEMAAENGCRQAQENLGYCHYYGRNMPVDYEKAFHYFALGAFDGHPISLYKIGDMYLNGYYVKKNEIEAFHIYQHALECLNEDTEKTVAGPVFLRLGKMYLNGTGTKKDAKSALVCYQKAEAYLYDMVLNGENMYRKSLQAAIEGQQKAREQLSSELPADTWMH